MKLIVGLGNPETKYTHTRHNVGFSVLDSFANRKGIDFQTKDKFKAEVAEYSDQGEKVMLVKPTTYYNLVGESVRLIMDFYKVNPADILIIHDELALPFGTVRTRIGGSDAGNNGIKSIIQHCGGDTARVRIGVYNELRDRIDDADFVLSNFSQDEMSAMPDVQYICLQSVNSFVAGTFETTTRQ